MGPRMKGEEQLGGWNLDLFWAGNTPLRASEAPVLIDGNMLSWEYMVPPGSGEWRCQ